MIPDDVNDIKAIAKKIEQAAHRNGWDQPPVLGYFARLHSSAGYVVRPMPIHLPGLHGSARIAVEIMVEAFRAGHEEGIGSRAAELFPADLRNMLAGIWLATEAWMNSIPVEERGGRSLADIPGSVEVRNVALIDCGGRSVYVDRVRGDKPKVTLNGPGIDARDGRVTGPLFEALRDLLVEMCKIMDDGQWAPAALARVGLKAE